jgi:hypothetical protein
MLAQVRPGYFSLGHGSPDYVTVCAVTHVCHVKSGYIMLRHVNSGSVWLFHFMSGYLSLVQVSSGYVRLRQATSC